jgi:hypothetical protein
MSKLSLAGVICAVIVLCLLMYLLKTNVIDNFVVFLDEIVIPKDCYNYLVTDGSKFYLLDTRKIFNNETNPLPFNTKAEALAFLNRGKCETNLPFVNLKNKKRKFEDPTVSFQRECNRKIAPNLFDLDICSSYSTDTDQSSAQLYAKLNKIESDKKVFANYDAETCMIDKAISEDKSLDDKQFKTYFADYFNRINSNIDEKFLYVTSN